MTHHYRWTALAAALPALLSACASAPPATPGTEGWLARADSISIVDVAPGVTHTRGWFASGPWSVHVLRIDIDRCRPVLRAAKAGPPLTERATTSAFGARALAAVNADFFAIPAGTPVGAHVTGGVLLIGPGERPVLGEARSGRAAGPAHIDGWVAAVGDTVAVAQVNRPLLPDADAAGLWLFSHWFGVDSTGGGIDVRRIEGDEARGRGVVVGAALPGAVPAGVVRLKGAAGWLDRRAAGDTVGWSVELRVGDAEEPVEEGIGGFPLLLAHGENVLAAQTGVRPEFGERRHPRTAVGWNRRSLFWVVVDGRQAPFSDGMSLAELATLFERLGALDAVNLDGGGSSTMVVRGRIVNQPSDTTGERPVGTALLLARCAGGGRPRPAAAGG